MNARADWSLEEAQAAQRDFEAAGGSWSDPVGPLYRWVALHTLEELRRAFEAGDRYALMQAIRRCANHDLPMPAWVGRAYIAAFDAVHNYRAKSWDAVFGAPLPNGAQLAALRKRREKSVRVWNMVNEHRARGAAITDELFEQIGRELGLGLTLTKEYYADRAQRRRRRTE